MNKKLEIEGRVHIFEMKPENTPALIITRVVLTNTGPSQGVIY